MTDPAPAFAPESLIDRAAAAGEAPVDLGATALALWADFHAPEAMAAALDHLDALGRETLRRREEGAPVVQALQSTLAGHYGYRGDSDTYDDLANADLVQVIARRRGLPVALGILYLHAARAAGATAHGLDAPGHFLIAIESAGHETVLDPFNAGRSVAPDEVRSLVSRVTGAALPPGRLMLRPLSDRGVLLRLLNNVRARTRRGPDRALLHTALKRMVRLAPELAEVWYELGVVETALEAPRAALAALGEALARAGDAPWRADADQLAASLRRRLN